MHLMNKQKYALKTLETGLRFGPRSMNQDIMRIAVMLLEIIRQTTKLILDAFGTFFIT